MSQATGLSRSVIASGIGELENRRALADERVRRPGAGRKGVLHSDPLLLKELEHLIEPVTRGDPMSPLLWTCKSLRRLAGELARRKHRVSHQTVAALLHAMDYSLQANRKNKEGAKSPDRDAQFQHIARQVQRQQAAGGPAISVDTKKKELVGDFKNNGQEWHPQGRPEEVRIHDFVIKELGRAAPYGIYDLTANRGWVSVGIDHDTAAFAVASIRWWWKTQGHRSYPKNSHLLITADCGGSNGNRVRLWKWELQKLANETGLHISVCHFPPGTSKWNKIEHRLFSFISQNWRGQPLLTHAAIVSLIANTRTATGLKVRCVLDTNNYPAKTIVTDKQMGQLRITRAAFHGDWNYAIHPRAHKRK